jgi:hypothetical protein
MKFVFGEICFIVNYQLAETWFVLVTSQIILSGSFLNFTLKEY